MGRALRVVVQNRQCLLVQRGERLGVDLAFDVKRVAVRLRPDDLAQGRSKMMDVSLQCLAGGRDDVLTPYPIDER